MFQSGGPRRACPPSHSGRSIPQRGRPPPARHVRSRGSLGCGLSKYCPSGHPSPRGPPRGLGQRGTPRPDHVTLKYSSPGGGQAALTRAAQAGRGTADGPPENIIGFPPPYEENQMYHIGECVVLWLLAKVAARLHACAGGAPSYSTHSDGPTTPCATPRGEISTHRRVRSRRSRGQSGKPGGASPGDGGNGSDLRADRDQAVTRKAATGCRAPRHWVPESPPASAQPGASGVARKT